MIQDLKYYIIKDLMMNETGKQVTAYDRSQDDLTILQDYTDGRTRLMNRFFVQLLHNAFFTFS